VLATVAAFFLILCVFYSSPFTTLANPPLEGNGLNPLLRFPAMMVHPPMLYSGYVGFSIPFAFCIGALITRRTDADWIRSTRRFALIAWTFLGFGVLLGSLWSFSELGWGGYWAWDPVENAAIMPWLTGTAFLHSIIVQEKRGMLRVWNVSLIIGTFVLSLLGTFLVRSGILQSIHAFGASTLGTPFLTFIAAVLAGSVVLVLTRLDSLASEARLDSFLSREAAFLFNNLILVGLCFVVFWGTFFPLLSKAVTGTESSVGPPWFDRYTAPLAIVLVLLSGIGPAIAWKRMNAKSLLRTLRVPGLFSVCVVVGLAAFTDAPSSPPSLLLFCFAAFVCAICVQEFVRGASARRAISNRSWLASLGELVARNRRRYGGYIVHIGIALTLLGVAASSAFVSQKDVSLQPGQSVQVSGYRLTYIKPTVDVLSDRSHTGAPLGFGAVVRVSKAGEGFTMRPTRNYYPSQDPSLGPVGRFFEGDATSEIGMNWGFTRTVWAAISPNVQALNGPIQQANRQFATADPTVQGIAVVGLARYYGEHPPPASFRILVSPFVVWIWIGGAVSLAGAICALWPSREAQRRKIKTLYRARLGRELTRV
jgi:cytochrome c-type biogenesis protein CcmF